MVGKRNNNMPFRKWISILIREHSARVYFDMFVDIKGKTEKTRIIPLPNKILSSIELSS